MMEKRLVKSLLPAFFLLVVFIGFFDSFFGLSLDDTVSTEKRALSKMPEWSTDSLATWPGKYEDYFNDHFAFRNLLIKVHSLIAVEVFDISSVADILKGNDGWLYYVRLDQGNSLGDEMGLVCLSENELKGIATGIEYRKRILDSMKIPYVIVIAPDKNSIYPEYLPANIKRRGPCAKRFDQVIDYLDANSTAKVLDIRPSLIAAKNELPYLVYFKTDSHWNDYGGFVAYREIMTALGLEPHVETDYNWSEASGPGGDLAGELSLAGRLTEDRSLIIESKKASFITKKEVNLDYGVGDMPSTHLVYDNANKNLPKLLIFHDSFGDALMKFLPDHFRETSCLTTYQFSPNFIAAEKPDFVVLETVERAIIFLSVKTFH